MSAGRNCFNCKYSGMDMDMDPYCIEPRVLEKHPHGLVLHSRSIVEFCPAPEHPLFVARKETPFYVASSWRNLLQPGIVHALRRCGHADGKTWAHLATSTATRFRPRPTA